jgi:hypothetical protein
VTDRKARIRGFLADYQREGVDAALYAFDPGIRWASPPEWMADTGYDGYDGLRALDALWRDHFDDFGLTLEDIHEVGDIDVVLVHQHGRIKGSCDQIRQKVGWVMTYGDDGLITHVAAYFSWAEALDAARAVQAQRS